MPRIEAGLTAEELKSQPFRRLLHGIPDIKPYPQKSLHQEIIEDTHIAWGKEHATDAYFDKPDPNFTALAYTANEQVLKQGGKQDEIYLVLEGQVRAQRTYLGGKRSKDGESII